jgi:sulfur carrier protein
MARVIFNGEARPLAGPVSIRELLEGMGLAGKRIAVERNGVVVPKARHADTLLADGDRLEVIVAVGGG